MTTLKEKKQLNKCGFYWIFPFYDHQGDPCSIFISNKAPIFRMSDSMEIIQKVILETLERDSEIADTRACLGSEFTSQQVIGVLMRLESHQVI